MKIGTLCPSPLSALAENRRDDSHRVRDMKPLRLFVEKIEQWRQASSQSGVLQVAQSLVAGVKRHGKSTRRGLRLKSLISLLFRPNATHRRFLRRRRRSQPRIVLAIAVLSLTSTIGYRFYDEPQLGVNTIAPQTLKAPATVRIVDQRTTEANRKAARTAAVPVMMLDPFINRQIDQTLQALLQEGETLRNQAGTLPFVETSMLSTNAQRYLRQAPEWEWRAAIAKIEGIPAPEAPPASSPAAYRSGASPQLATLELQNYRRSNSTEDFSALKDVINRARQRYAEALLALPNEADNFYAPSLFDLTNSEWAQVKTHVRQVSARMLSQGIAPGTPPTLLDNAIRVHLQGVAIELQPQATQMIAAVIRPNLTQDPERTKLQAEQAAQSVKDVMVSIRRGDVIVKQGEQISQADFVLLDHFGLSRRRINGWGLLGFGGLVSGAVAVFLVVERKFHSGMRRRDRLLVLLLTLTAPVISALGLPATSLPVIGLLVGSFYGSALGVTVIGLLALLLPIGMEISGVN